MPSPDLTPEVLNHLDELRKAADESVGPLPRNGAYTPSIERFKAALDEHAPALIAAARKGLEAGSDSALARDLGYAAAIEDVTTAQRELAAVRLAAESLAEALREYADLGNWQFDENDPLGEFSYWMWLRDHDELRPGTLARRALAEWEGKTLTEAK